MRIKMVRFNVRNLWLFDAEGGSGVGVEVSAGSPTQEISVPSTNASAEIPSSGNSENKTIDWGSYIPAESKDKPYFQQILKSENPGVELVKQFEHAQQLIGKKSVNVPGADASDDDWNKYYETTRPGSADEYDFKPVDLGEEHKELAERINKDRDAEFLKGVKQDMYEEGLTKRQAERIAAKYEKRFAEKYVDIYKKEIEAAAAQEAEFDALVKSSFGGDEAKALAAGKDVIQKHVPEKIRSQLGDIEKSNKALIALAAVGLSVSNTFEKEDGFDKGSAAKGDAPSSIAELNKQQQDLMALPAASSKMHPDHDIVIKQIQAISDKIVDIRKSQNKK